ncbi:hypothetical protein GLOIN_2v1678443 [Rhizophagus irregularis DAOM 181602=DAOM 197198]|uniref:Uncharacterized protein n=1 Tax=Rhizophagus irregularis (strain DAOM 181602 / DAOM 197198 / MUCL 43194) TaxID=747089 RepID=A0A2P4PFQ3_RHIID|nr:hypothetical protein GLOIN_2v1678443 [Rhizophagus irregularis DAOM 181602=DAOM 197198]POG64187.1 hypothetical protein GLOIN_2v1678443 [Rhizophagus irregularis DAOM 181602=DAOM 197198]|eukprot:XP_025171053.1 hypothetical protein GLOIN_2v1678443 [Rhizophagus irregularis DAOM 181602=DAOM 197198]
MIKHSHIIRTTCLMFLLLSQSLLILSRDWNRKSNLFKIFLIDDQPDFESVSNFSKNNQHLSRHEKLLWSQVNLHVKNC